MDEISRIKEAYARRDLQGKNALYSRFDLPALFIYQQRERELLWILSKFGMSDLFKFNVLDVGSGNGTILRDFIQYGALPEACHGIDIISDRISEAQKMSPNINFHHCSAERIPYNNNYFDIVMQFTVFTSIFDEDMKKVIASEMLRVLKPDGIIVWYDFLMNNPGNPDVRGLKKREIYRLFPKCDIYLKRVTVAPPVVRVIAPYSILICQLLEKLYILNTHYLGVIKKS